MIAIGSGKGGAGKSTVTASVVVAMTDADVHRPSIPGNSADNSAMAPEGYSVPVGAHGVDTISMAMLTDDDTPAILRGQMVTNHLQMFVKQVDRGPHDVPLTDLPPGIGEIRQTLAQAFPSSGMRRVDPAVVPRGIGTMRVWSVGNDAPGLALGDEHDTGLYTCAALRGLQGKELEDV